MGMQVPGLRRRSFVRGDGGGDRKFSRSWFRFSRSSRCVFTWSHNPLLLKAGEKVPYTVFFRVFESVHGVFQSVLNG